MSWFWFEPDEVNKKAWETGFLNESLFRKDWQGQSLYIYGRMGNLIT